MILHAFEGRCAFHVCLGRLEESLIIDCGCAWVGTVTLFSTVPISSEEGLGLVQTLNPNPKP